MKLIALLLALLLEKASTNLLNLHEFRWLDACFDWAIRTMQGKSGAAGTFVAVVTVLVLVSPVLLLSLWLHKTFGSVIYFLLAVPVLFICLGPRDLSAEVEEFSEALSRGDDETSYRVAKELLEFDPPEDLSARGKAVASAIFVQSNNRTFGVILWFMLLGPTGAWAFRVTDLFRRRAFFENDRAEHDGKAPAAFLKTIQQVHGVLAWLPSRFAAMSFALAGSFEPATSAWKNYYKQCAEHFFEVNDDVVATAGCGALGRQMLEDTGNSEISAAQGAINLVQRSLIAWLVIIGLLTIAGAAA